MTLVVEHHEELEIDLLRQGFDLLDFWRGRITPRRLRVLIRGLAHTSLTVGKIAPEAAYIAQWSATDYILANFYDAFTAANFKEPKPYLRPAEAWHAERKAEQMAAMLEAQAERNRLRDKQAG